jgi:8-oxo-dGTP pyrophosphatase MutT (NUDIX family)
MPIPPHIAELRALVGHRLLWLATARAVVADGRGCVVLGRYASQSDWTLPGGVIDPAEQPADAAVRECYEETGIVALPEALSSITVSELVLHPSGDLSQHLDITFRCRAVGGQAQPGDGEFEEVRWHRIDELPAMSAYNLDLLCQAVSGGAGAAFAFSGLGELSGLPASWRGSS